MASPITPLSKMKRFLCVAPHPDDAELGMGGTLIVLAKAGHHVTICDLTNGEPTPNGTPETRQKEWTEATRRMNEGLDTPIERRNLYLKNRELEHTIANRHALAATIRETRPDVVFYPYYPDAHPDHIAAHKLAIDARFDAKLTNAPNIRGEPHHPKRIIQYFCTHLRTDIVPTFCVDVSEVFEQKLHACRGVREPGAGRRRGVARLRRHDAQVPRRPLRGEVCRAVLQRRGDRPEWAQRVSLMKKLDYERPKRKKRAAWPRDIKQATIMWGGLVVTFNVWVHGGLLLDWLLTGPRFTSLRTDDLSVWNTIFVAAPVIFISYGFIIAAVINITRSCCNGGVSAPSDLQ